MPELSGPVLIIAAGVVALILLVLMIRFALRPKVPKTAKGKNDTGLGLPTRTKSTPSGAAEPHVSAAWRPGPAARTGAAQPPAGVEVQHDAVGAAPTGRQPAEGV